MNHMMHIIAKSLWQALSGGRWMLPFFMLFTQISLAQISRPGPMIVCPAGEHSHSTRVAAPLRLKNDLVTAEFNVIYSGFENFPEAQAAFQFAVDIWSREIVSLIPIEVEATFAPLEPRVLGSAGPRLIVGQFSSNAPSDQWFPVALANSIANRDLFPDDSDIVATFNSTRDDYYFGLDGNPPDDQIDFVSVVLHELGHGLGFTGSADVNQINRGSLGLEANGETFLVRYDTFIQNGDGQDITGFPNNSAVLSGELRSNDLFFAGDSAISRNGGSAPQIYAPTEFDDGSSFAHWDEDAYPPGDPNSLMTPFTSRGEGLLDVGDITRGMLQDLGWQLNTNQGVIFGSFSAFREGPDGFKHLNDVIVEWTTVVERSNAGFEVEKSLDGGQSFSVIGTFDALGDTDTARTYRLTDPFAADGGTYRVRQISLNGQAQFTQEETVSGNGNAPFTFIIFPNPVQDEVRISFGENEDPLNPTYDLNASISVEVIDIRGSEVISFEQSYGLLERSLAVSISDLLPGHYILRLSTPWGEFRDQFIRY